MILLSDKPRIELYYDNNMKVMPHIKDKAYDWAICDIPYGIGVGNMPFLRADTRVTQKNGTKLNARKQNNRYTPKDWDMTSPPQEYFDELRRISANQIIFGIEYVNWTGVGTGRIRWDKCVADGMSFKQHEIAYCSSIDYTMEFKLLWSGMMQAKSLKEPTTQQGNKKLNEKRNHPTHKPRLLYKWLINQFVTKDQNIIDTNLGDGENLIAAWEMGHDFTGIEIDNEYICHVIKHFKELESQHKLQF